ncbi:tRNA-specific adenosine deaminase [Roseovarius gaetbuli]|uniref:tRNA-specific adenosine deaminase n=1 Tax=Roseovarius gaetbuli TaxID=1356575 RepID=A0A1X6Z5P6_9RHOB|nr:nucleoside deaminase [Roseovarius gaetbuli]SLN41295.1 tRNA-specific adenosine deaminase [Roseovarius gaetbuli]
MPYLKAALQELIVNENYSFGGQKEAYLKALEQAYETHRGKPIQIPRNLTDQHKVVSIQDDFETTATLSAQIIRDLKARLKKSDISEELRPLIKRTGALLTSDNSAAFQNQALWACLALEAAANGDFGVGAVLVDRENRIVAMAKNTVFTRQNTSCHAEMNIISGLQIDGKALSENGDGLKDLTLISSLEPCPMCLSRISMTPIQKTLYLSPDPEGGMVTHKDHMPKVWKRFLSDKSFEKSHYEALEKLAKDIFDYTEAQNEMLGA